VKSCKIRTILQQYGNLSHAGVRDYRNHAFGDYFEAGARLSLVFGKKYHFMQNGLYMVRLSNMGRGKGKRLSH
jgi:hypothetical protein